MVNPFNPVAYQRGFFVPREASGAIVSYAQFEGQGTSTWGLQLENAPVTNAIGIPNNSPIRGLNSTNTGDFKLLYVGSDNAEHVADDNTLSGLVLGHSTISIPNVGVTTGGTHPVCVSGGPGTWTLYIGSGGGC